MKPIISALILLLILPAALLANDVYLRRFVGNWKGNYQLFDLAGKQLGSYQVEQVYYWVDNQLWGETALQLPDGSIQKEFSQSYFEDEVAHAVVESALSQRKYYGWYHHQKIWWLSALNEKRTDFQFHTETLTPGPTGFELHINGLQWSKDLKNPQFVRVVAVLFRPKDQPFELFGQGIAQN